MGNRGPSHCAFGSHGHHFPAYNYIGYVVWKPPQALPPLPWEGLGVGFYGPRDAF